MQTDFFDKMFFLKYQTKNYLRYLYALLAVSIVILTRFALLPLTGKGMPFITLFPATVIIALLGGMGPAIVTGVIGVLLCDYFFIPNIQGQQSLEIGLEFWSRTSIVVLTSVFVGYVGAVLRQARLRAENQALELNRSRRDLKRAQTVANTGNWRLDVRNNKLIWSDEVYRIFGLASDSSLTYESFLSYIHPDDRDYVNRKWEAALKGENYDIEHRIVVGKKIKWVHEKAELEYEKDGSLSSGFGTVTDITEQKQREKELHQLNRTLKALRKSTQAITLAKDEQKYLQNVCDIIINYCGHAMVWIGFTQNDDAKSVKPVACSGFEVGYLDTLKITWADTARGRGPTGTAIRTGKASICKNIPTNPVFEPWRADAIKRGYASSISLPLLNGDKAFGSLTIYSREVDPFSRDEVNLLSELASDLSLGISTIRLRVARDEAEESLRKNEATLRGILDATKESIWLFSADGVVLMGNPTALSRFKNPVDEIIGKHISSFLPAELAKSRFAHLRETVESARPLEFEDTRDNIIFHHSFYPIQNSQGYVTSVVSFSRDITESKHAEEALRKSEKNYRELVQNANSAIIRWNRNGNITLFNEYAEQFFGYSSEEVLGKKVDFLIPDGDSFELNPSELIANILNDPQHYASNVNENICSDGRLVWMAWTNKPIYDENGEVSEILAVGTDITKRREMEEELRKSRDELEIRVRERTLELEKTNEQLKEEIEERLRREQFLRLEEARLDALLSLSEISEASLDKITNFTLEQAIALTHSKIGFIGFLNEDETMYELHSVSKDVVKGCNVEGDPVHWPVEGAGIWADAIRQRRTLFINDYSKPHPHKKGFPIGHLPMERFMIVPVFEGEKIVTLAGVGNKDTDYDKTDERQVVLLLSAMWNSVQKKRSRERALAERQRFNDVLETLPVYVCLLTPDYYMPFANKVFRNLFGYYPDKKCYEFLFNRNEPCENCETYKVLKTNQPQHWEWTGPNGRNYDIFDFPFRDTDGSQLILEMGIDITERKQAEDAVRQGEERYRSLTEATTQIVWTTDPQGQVVNDLPLWREFTGQSIDEIQGWGWINAVNPDDREQTARIWTKAVQEKTLYETEYRIRRKDGEYRYVSVRGVPVMEQEDSIREWIGTCTDITEQKRAQEELRSASLYSRSLLEASLDPLVTISAEGKITDVNEATVQATGIPREELIGTDFSNYFTEPDKAREGYQKVFEKGFVTDYPLTVRHKNGKLTDVLYNATVYKNEEGEVQGIFAAARDITEKKIAEAELEEYRLHLEELVKLRTEELARSNKDLEQFAYVASHDLQEPLRAVAGFVGLLQRQLQDSLTDKTKEYMHFTVDGVHRMQSLINGLLEYSRIDTRGKPPVETKSSKPLEDAILSLHTSIGESAASITSDKLPTVNIDPVQLTQLFQNLISNAIKFRSEKPPEIHVSATRAENAWKFSVKDNGIGIEPQYAERIFMIFQRLHTRKQYPGTGIGLSLCKKIVERHGGKIWMESEPGKGSTFYFTIPDLEGRN